MKKKLLATLALGAIMSASLTGCDNAKYKIGILLPVEHAALQASADGFVAGLVESGLKRGSDFSIESKNASGKDADLANFAKQLVGSKDMTFGLGTGASQMLKSASIDKGSTKPVLFSAVTDAVQGGLVESIDNPTGFVCGTSDAQPIDAQIGLIKECIPGADKIGILYTQSEVNSRIQAEQARACAESLGMKVETMTATDATDITTVALALAQTEGIDAIYVPTDNNIAAHMNDVKEAANTQHVLVITGEENMLKEGGHITLSVDYFELGKVTGRMAAQIIKGEKTPTDFPVVTMTKDDCKYVYSSKNVASSGITLPESVIKMCKDISLE